MPAGWTTDDVDRWIAYHSEITKAMVTQRTSLESRLVPVTAYVLVAAVECYRRHPEMILRITEAMAPEDIGRAGRERPGTQVDAVHLWSAANIFLHGRQILMLLGRIAADHEPGRTAVVADFWQRAAKAYRDDGHTQAWDAGFTVRPYLPEVIDELVAGCRPPDDTWPAVRRLNATLTTYLFLLYFDTRAGIADSGPYDLGGGRVLLVRDFSKMGPSDFPWSTEVASGMPYRNLTAAFVLDGVGVQVNDWGTSITDPPDYHDHVTAAGLFTTDNGRLEPVPLAEADDIRVAAREAQTAMYRLVAAMSRRERVHAGAYVYFGFLRPFAEVAGVAGTLDWDVPQASDDVYEWLEPFEGTGQPPDPDAPYYWPIAERTLG